MKKLLIAAMLAALAVPVAAQGVSATKPVGDVPIEFDFEQEALGVVTEKGTIPEHAKNVIIEFLALTEDQIAAWDMLVETAQADAEPIHAEIEVNRELLREQLESGSPDAQTVGELVIANYDLWQVLGDIHRNYVEEFELLLDEEQLRRLNLVRGAARVWPVIPAFRIFGLVRIP